MPETGEQAPRTTVTVEELRRAARAGHDTSSAMVALLEELHDVDAQLRAIREAFPQLAPWPRELLVWAAGLLSSPVDGFIEEVLRDASQPGSVRYRAAEVLARRSTPGWEALVASEMVVGGRSHGQRSDAVGALLFYGTGEQWAIVLDFLRRDLRRKNRPACLPSEIARASAYILRGMPRDQVPELVALLRAARENWTGDEYRWLTRYWPALLDDDDPDPDWDAAGLAAWESALGVTGS